MLSSMRLEISASVSDHIPVLGNQAVASDPGQGSKELHVVYASPELSLPIARTECSLMALSLHHIHCLPLSSHRSGCETASWSM